MASADPTYPFTPKSNVKLRPGQFWGHQLSDRRFACSRVLGVLPGSRSRFIFGVLDWIGDSPPTEASTAGAPVLEVGDTDVKRAFGKEEEPMLGFRQLEDDGIEPVTKAFAYLLPKPRAEWLFLHGSEPTTWGMQEVASPLTSEMLAPFRAEKGVVQFKSLLTDADFLRLAAWLEAYPQLTLRAYGSYDGSITDLELLRFFPGLTRFSGDVLYALTSLD